MMTSTRTRRYVLGSALTLVAAAAAAGCALVGRPAMAQAEDAPAKDTPAKDTQAKDTQAKDTLSLKGQAAPDFSLKTVDGKDVKLSDHKGKVVLLDFWATWCPPCVKGLPHMDELARDKARAEKGLVVLAINAQEQPERVQKFMEDRKLNLTVPMDAEGKAAEAYLIAGYPTTVVVGRDGKISEVFQRLPEKLSEIDEAVDKALGSGAKPPSAR